MKLIALALLFAAAAQAGEYRVDLYLPQGKGPFPALDYEHWPLFGGPFLEAAVDSQQLTLKYGNMRRVLDFRSLTVRESSAGPLR